MTNSDYFNSEAISNRDKWMNAVPNKQEQLHPPAPYIIQIVNNGGLAINNVDIGDSYLNRTTSNFGQSDSLAITSTLNNVTYTEYLAQTEVQPFIVGLTMIISTTANQVENYVAVTHRNAEGERLDTPLGSTIDPYQKQTDRVINDLEYMMDGMTRLRIRRIEAGATVTIRQYLKNKFAANQIIAGRPSMQSYQNPNVLKAFAEL